MSVRRADREKGQDKTAGLDQAITIPNSMLQHKRKKCLELSSLNQQYLLLLVSLFKVEKSNYQNPEKEN